MTTGLVMQRGLLGYLALCWSPDDPPVPAPAPAPIPEPPKPIVFNTPEAFNERVDQKARALLKDKYGLTEAQLDARLKQAKDLEEAEAARVKAQQTKEERLEGEKAKAEADAAAARADADAARRQAKVTSLCAQKGIRNVDYALYEAERSRKTDAELEAHFDELLKDEAKKSALGISTPAPEVVPVPAITAPGTPPAGPPPAPPVPGTPPGTVDVMKMDQQTFQRHLQSLG